MDIKSAKTPCAHEARVSVRSKVGRVSAFALLLLAASCANHDDGKKQAPANQANVAFDPRPVRPASLKASHDPAEAPDAAAELGISTSNDSGSSSTTLRDRDSDRLSREHDERERQREMENRRLEDDRYGRPRQDVQIDREAPPYTRDAEKILVTPEGLRENPSVERKPVTVNPDGSFDRMGMVQADIFRYAPTDTLGTGGLVPVGGAPGRDLIWSGAAQDNLLQILKAEFDRLPNAQANRELASRIGLITFRTFLSANAVTVTMHLRASAGSTPIKYTFMGAIDPQTRISGPLTEVRLPNYELRLRCRDLDPYRCETAEVKLFQFASGPGFPVPPPPRPAPPAAGSSASTVQAQTPAAADPATTAATVQTATTAAANTIDTTAATAQVPATATAGAAAASTISMQPATSLNAENAAATEGVGVESQFRRRPFAEAWTIARDTAAFTPVQGAMPGTVYNRAYNAIAGYFRNTADKDIGPNHNGSLSIIDFITSETIYGSSTFQVQFNFCVSCESYSRSRGSSHSATRGHEYLILQGPLVKQRLSHDITYALDEIGLLKTTIGGDVNVPLLQERDSIKKIELLKNTGQGDLLLRLHIRPDSPDEEPQFLDIEVSRRLKPIDISPMAPNFRR